MLQTFTKTTENSALPSNMSVMSGKPFDHDPNSAGLRYALEFADVTESILKNSALLDALKDPKIAPYFRSLSVTDQPRERPTKLDSPEKHVILDLVCPSPSQAVDTTALVAALFPFIDSLSKINLRPETKTKLKKVRETFEKSLKVEAEQAKKEEVSSFLT